MATCRFLLPAFFFGERLPNARRSRARVLLAPRTGQTVRGRVGDGVRVRVRVRVGVGWGLCRYLGQKCAKTSCKNSLQARPANRGSPLLAGRVGSGRVGSARSDSSRDISIYPGPTRLEPRHLENLLRPTPGKFSFFLLDLAYDSTYTEAAVYSVLAVLAVDSVFGVVLLC